MKNLVKISILYSANMPFDFDYYLTKHMPRALALLGGAPGYRGVSVERGVMGGAPGSPAAYVAMCHYLFDSTESFLAAFMPHADELQGDMKNYAGEAPTIQISEVLLAS